MKSSEKEKMVKIYFYYLFGLHFADFFAYSSTSLILLIFIVGDGQSACISYDKTVIVIPLFHMR